MLSPTARVTRGGKTLSRRFWALIDEVEKEVGFELRLMQGAYNKGGVSQSAGTHDGSGAADFSVRKADGTLMTEKEAIKVVVAFRKWFGIAWLRSPKFGWPARLGGPHIHVILADEPGLSYGARRQVINYNNRQNGLASRARDPFPRPAQRHFHLPGTEPKIAAGAREVRLANLKYGKIDQDVKDLQNALNAKMRGTKLLVDGVYGATTDAAVRKHQGVIKVGVDPAKKSYVGPRQAAALGLKVVG